MRSVRNLPDSRVSIEAMRRLRCLLILALSAMPLRAAEPFQIVDDFSSYADTSGGEPRWNAMDVGFLIERGAMQAELRGRRSFAVLEAAPAGRVVTIEASITPHEGLGKDWRTAGVGVFLDAKNFWHVALVESPDGQRRFAELSEMLEGEWNAQSAAGTKLTTIEEHGPGEWRQGQTYRVRLALARDGEHGKITGEIFEGDTLRYRCVRALEGRAVDRGRPMLAAGAMRASFDDVRARVAEIVETPAAVAKSFPPFQSSPIALQGKPRRSTGFFRAEAEGDTWWLIDPLGQPTLSIGTDHVRYEGHWCEALGYAPYGRYVAKKYGSAEAWADETTQRLRAWNFNVLGAGNSEQARHRGLAHTEFLSFGAEFSSTAALVEKTFWTGWPDVFDPRFERFCELRARERCAPHRDDPWLLGYFLDNELEWWGKSHRPWGLAEDTCKLPASAAGKKALVASLRRSFQDDAAAFNAEFGATLGAFDDLLALTELPQPKTDRAKKALADFIAEAATRYFQITTAAVRRHDPNHLIIGCRFAHDAPEAAWTQAGATCDVVTVNVYPRLDLRGERVPGNDEHLRSRFALCGKPLIVTEWSFPALDARDSTGRPLPSRHGAGMRVDTQEQRACCYAIFQRQLFALPFVIGSHYFMWMDEPALGISTAFPEDSNYGLVSESDEPYPPITAAATRVNPQLPALHAGTLKASDISAGAPVADRPPQLPTEPGELKFTRTGAGFTIENGPLRLDHDATRGAAFERISRREADGRWMELGTYEAVLFVVDRGQNQWPRAERVTTTDIREQTSDRLVLEMEFAHTAPPAWKAAYRFTVERGRPWFRAQALWVENGGSAPWQLRGYFHYLPSRIGGDAQDDEPGGPRVPSYYLPVAAWRDPATRWNFGVLAPRMDDERLLLHFWTDAFQHPDGWRKLDRELAPGTRWQADAGEPVVAVFGLRETPENPRPWLNLAATLEP